MASARSNAAILMMLLWLPTCCSVDDPPRYPPVLAGEHLVSKLMGPRLLRPSVATDTAGDRGR